jgi:hypothetical protein
MNILVIDIGGSKLKVLATGQSEPRRARSGRRLVLTELTGIEPRAEK